MAGFSWEKRPLKRPRLGPPDVYPQDPKQREDELTAINVKQGFSHIPQISDEFGTARNCNISEAKLGAFINGAISTKVKLNVLPDCGKRRIQVNTKDHFWPVTPRLQKSVDVWMRDLCGTKPLSVLAKRVPTFNKREEIFFTLAEHSVPMLKATWFLKMTAAFYSAMSEAKTKKRTVPDPSQEWTIVLQRCLKDILVRLADWYHGGTGSSSSNSFGSTQSGASHMVKSEGSYGLGMSNSTSGSPLSSDDGNAILKQWVYCTELAKHMYNEGLLDRLEWLTWIIEACERVKTLDDGAWKALIPLLLSFLPEIAQSEFLSRRLAYLAARRLSTLFIDFDPNARTLNGNTPAPPAALVDHLNCPAHRKTVFALSSAIQVVTLECPTALVLNSNFTGEGKEKMLIPHGSPLDILAVPPSALPMPARANNPIIRTQLRYAEEKLRSRSRAVEARWSCEEWQHSSAGKTLEKVLAALDALDRHNFYKMENSFDVLYSKVFPHSVKKDNPEADTPIVLLLCKWAVVSQRSGEHRAAAVAKLLEHRQIDYASIMAESDVQAAAESGKHDTSNASDDMLSNGPDSVGTENEVNGNVSFNGSSFVNDEDSDGSLPVYHNLLFRFLDAEAPTLDESSGHSKVTFGSLVHLFSALIRHDVFSHDAYLCTLVARGDLSSAPPAPSAISNAPSVPPVHSVATTGPGSHPGPGTPASVLSVTPGATPHHDLDDRGPLFQPLPRMQEIPNRQPDFGDDRNIDDDLDRLLQHITQEQQNNLDQVDSPKEDNSSNNAAAGFGTMSTPSHQTGGSSNSNSVDNQAAVGNSAGPPKTTSGNFDTLKQSRHRVYVTHFPLPQDEAFAHEVNQRHVLLYGVGRSRDEARHAVKKVSKELSKLFSKKFCYDGTDSGRQKKHSKGEFNLESLQSKFSALPYFDQHQITSYTAQSVVEMLSTFVSGRNNYLPTVEHIAFLFELMESSLNITGLLETTVQVMKELPDIESKLVSKQSSIMGTYTSSLLLQLVSILRLYHRSLLLEHELVKNAWDYLIRVVRRLSSQIDCTTAERCALSYLTELSKSCFFLKIKNLESLSTAARTIRVSLTADIKIPESCDTHKWKESYMTHCLEHPRRKVESNIVRQLADSSECRYSFVCNAILSICNEADTERLNDLAALCAEMTASCPALAPEWLRALDVLCTNDGKVGSYGEILAQTRVTDFSTHSNLATLTAVLIARQCFSLPDFFKVAVKCLLQKGRPPGDSTEEAGARLTCNLFLSLFRGQKQVNSDGEPNVLKFSCDKRLLSAFRSNLLAIMFMLVLKAILHLADASKAEKKKDLRNTSAAPSISQLLGTSDAPSERCDALRGDPRTFSSFAYNALQQMCAEPWVRQGCLRDISEIFEPLLDNNVSFGNTQKLVQLIFYHDKMLPEDSSDYRIFIPKVLGNLNQWNLREAWLALTLQHRQLLDNSSEHQQWLDVVARAALDVFHLGGENGQDFNQFSAAPSPAPGKSPRSGKKAQDSNKLPASTGYRGAVNGDANIDKQLDKCSSKVYPTSAPWLVAFLVEKLSSDVQGRVLRHAGSVLENSFWKKGNKVTSDTSPKMNLEAHLPFLSLILSCLRGQDEQKESLLASLLSQFTQLVSHSKDPDFDSTNSYLRDALRLRLNLVGGMFDGIQRSSSATSDWAVILTQLVTQGVVDLNNNSDVFPTVVDMITALVHSTQFSDSSEREESRKQNMNLIKKLKKELADRNSESTKPLRQLLPVSKVQTEVIVSAPTSTTTDSKGNRIQSFDIIDKKPGLKAFEKQRISAWDLLEGQRNPPLSWAWFGAVKMERKPLRYEEGHRLLKFHTHSLVKPVSHYLDPPPLPPEDVDMKPEIPPKEEIKPDTPMSSDQSPRGTPMGGRKPKPPRKKRQTKAQQAQPGPVQPQQPANLPNAMAHTPSPQIRPGSPYGAPNVPPMGPSGVNPNTGNYPSGPPPQWQPGYQQPYFPPNQGVRQNQAKLAVQEMIRVRHRAPQPGPQPGTNPPPFQQFQPTTPAGPPVPSRAILRTQLRPQQPQGQLPNQQFQGQVPPNQNMYQQPPMNQAGMSQSFGYNGPQPGAVSGGQQGGMNTSTGMMQQGQSMMGAPSRGPGPGGPEMGNFNPQVRGMTQRPFMGQGGHGGQMSMPQNFRMNQVNQMVQGGTMSGPQMNQGQMNQQNMPQQGQMMGQMMNQGMIQQGQQMMGQNPGMMGQNQQMMTQNQQMMPQNQNMMSQNQGMMAQQNMQRYRMMMQQQQQQQQQQPQQQQGQPGQMGPGQMAQGGPQQNMGMGGPRPPMHFSNQPPGY